MFNFVFYAFSFLLITFLSGCDKKSAPLPGIRKSVIQATSPFSSTLLPKTALAFSKAEANFCWSHTSGASSHSFRAGPVNTSPSLIWKQKIGSAASEGFHFIASPILAKGILYTLDGDSNLSAIIPSPSSPPKGRVLWSLELGKNSSNIPCLGGGLAHNGNKVFVTTGLGDVIAVADEKGSLLWKTNLGFPIRSAPTAHAGIVYVTTVHNETFALTQDTGKILWHHNGVAENALLLGGPSPAILGGVVIVAYSSGEVSALNAKDGQVLWDEAIYPGVRSDTVATMPHIRAHPVINSGMVFVISHCGKTLALNLNDGSRIWEKDFGGVQTPVIIDNSIFFASEDNTLVCLNKNTGDIIWNMPLPSASPIQYWVGPIATGNTLIMTNSEGKFLFIDAAKGTIMKEKRFEGSSHLSPIAVEGILYLLTDQAMIQTWK